MRKYKVPPLPQTIWKNPLHFIAFGFGAGALPIAPGTFGTLVAIPFYLLLSRLSVLIYFIILMIIILMSIWITEKVSQEIKVDDHQAMCLDEIVGFLVTMFAIPPSFGWILLGFILFRLFDIWKPQPIAYLDEKIKGGAGVILDDVAAGIMSCVILHGLRYLL